MKSIVRAVAEAAIFQAVVFDSKSRKRAVAIYACGDDVVYADDALGLFDRDRRRAAPDWLKTQLRNLPDGAVRFDWRGEKVAMKKDGVEMGVPRGEVSREMDAAPIVRTPPGEQDLDLDDESSIQQG